MLEWCAACAATIPELTNQIYNTMLKERITNLLDRYEYGEEDGGWLSVDDVKEELEEIIDEEPYDDELNPKLEKALADYVLALYEYERYGGHVSPGSDEFIEAVESAVGYE